MNTEEANEKRGTVATGQLGHVGAVGGIETRIARMQGKVEETAAVIELIKQLAAHVLDQLDACVQAAADTNRTNLVRSAMNEFNGWSNLLHDLNEAAGLEKSALRHWEQCLEALKAEAGKAGNHGQE